MRFRTSLAMRAQPVSGRLSVVTHAAAPPPRTTTVPPAATLPPPSPGTPDNVGDKLSEWLKSPFDFAAFGPRLTVGSMLSLPDRLNSMQAQLRKLQEIAESPAPVEDKTKLLLAEIEDATTEFLEKGAYVEADFIKLIKSSLPADIAEQIEMPETPNTTAPESYEATTGPITTSTGPVVTELPPDVDLN